MALELDDRLEAAVARHTPYLRRLLEQAALRALRLHAEHLTVEHLVGAALEDEDCAAHEAVVHAFADPETLDAEALALSPGVMVVGSAAALPFSPRSVAALTAARDEAAREGWSAVRPEEILRHGIEALDPDLRESLAGRGYRPPGPGAPPSGPGESGSGGVPAEGSLFRGLSGPAKQVLSLANRQAHGARERSIGPARLVLAVLRQERELADRCGLSALVAQELLRGRTLDPSEPDPRPVRPDDALRGFLEQLPPPAGSLEVLLACHRQPEGELAQLLTRHKVTQPLLERSRTAFEDPEA